MLAESNLHKLPKYNHNNTLDLSSVLAGKHFSDIFIDKLRLFCHFHALDCSCPICLKYQKLRYLANK